MGHPVLLVKDAGFPRSASVTTTWALVLAIQNQNIAWWGAMSSKFYVTALLAVLLCNIVYAGKDVIRVGEDLRYIM